MAKKPNRVLLMAGVMAVLMAVGSAGPAIGSQLGGPEVRAFVTRTYVGGVPYQEARALGSQAVPELVSMLEDPSLEAHWSTIVFALGAIGDPSAVEPLQGFLRRQHGEVSLSTFQATLGVPPALGCIANAGDPTALRALVRLTKLDRGSKAEARGSYRHYRGAAMKEVLGRMAIQGLGLSGTAEASQRLEAMRTDRKLRSDWRDNVIEASALATRVRREGLEAILGGGHDQNR